MENNLEAITKLSDLIGEDPVLTGQVIQTGLNIFEKFGETSDGLADKLNKLINTTAAGSQGGIGEFFQLFSDAAPIAAEAGVGFDVLSASFATLRDNGLPASVAATGLKMR
ncbi:MAG: phage tail tape measure protein [Leptolyngbya sp. RL_3_1]|nr:phage tail tape measure protein [Leptolyngbya sp. RL_3_1]